MELLDVVIKRICKSSQKTDYLESNRVVLDKWDRRNQTKLKLIKAAFKMSPDFKTTAYLFFDERFITYEFYFTSAFKAALFCRKHDFLSLKQIMEATDVPLRKELFRHVRNYEIARIKRHARYEDSKCN